MPRRIIILPSGTTWNAPSTTTLLESVECWGGGAPGNNGDNIGSGGAGAYSKTNNIIVSPNQTCYIQIPGTTAITESNPVDTWFNKNTNAAPTNTSQGCLAKSGQKGTASTGGLGGNAASCIGDVKYSGGDGNYTSGSSIGGCGGGGSASPFGNGNNGGINSGSTGGNGGDSPGAGNGGIGSGSSGTSNENGGGGGAGGLGDSLSPGNGGNGGIPGGGGGLSGTGALGNHSASGGNGTRGQIRITYYKKYVLII